MNVSVVVGTQPLHNYLMNILVVVKHPSQLLDHEMVVVRTQPLQP